MLKTLIKDKIELSHKSIINELRGYRNRPEDAICEYIWNSFDAQSTTVNINYDFINGTESAVAFGYPSLSVSDNGTGWDLSNTQTAKLFLDSQKSLHKNRFKSIPHGSKGVGRFTFYCFASKAIWESHFNGQSYQLTLERESLASYEIDSSKLGPTDQNGTTVRFEVDNTLLNESFFEDVLPARLLEKFAWFLIEHPEKQININGNPLDLNSIIKNRKEESLIIDGKTVLLDLVQWNRSLADQENSRAYYIGNDSEEICKYPTGLNNKADDFYHSAFVRSASFDTVLFDFTENGLLESDQGELFDVDNGKEFIKTLRAMVRQQLEVFRHPYIVERSDQLVSDWVGRPDYPKPEAYGADPQQYKDLVKQTLIIAPNIFVGVADSQRKIILSLLASLLGTYENELIIKIISQVYDMSLAEKNALQDILNRTTLKNILHTISEIDKRLQIIEVLDKIVNDPQYYRETKEVTHLQEILNENTWIFGEEFRLVMESEGSIRNAIKKWAREILQIEDLDPATNSRRELDLLLSKKIETENRIENIVIELKRPSVKLGSSELNQLKDYRNKIMSDPACKGPNIFWQFILVGQDYDQDIMREIESHRNSGERHRGLVDDVPTENTKIYVRKWTEIINVEQRSKHRFLKDKLQIQLNEKDNVQTVDEIVDSVLSTTVESA